MHKQTWFLSYQRSITRKAMVHGGFDFHFLKVVREQEMETVEMVVTASSAAARVSLKSALREWMFGCWETTWGGSARAPRLPHPNLVSPVSYFTPAKQLCIWRWILIVFLRWRSVHLHREQHNLLGSSPNDESLLPICPEVGCPFSLDGPIIVVYMGAKFVNSSDKQRRQKTSGPCSNMFLCGEHHWTKIWRTYETGPGPSHLGFEQFNNHKLQQEVTDPEIWASKQIRVGVSCCQCCRLSIVSLFAGSVGLTGQTVFGTIIEQLLHLVIATCLLVTT